MAEKARSRSISVSAEHQEMWDDMDALAELLSRPLSGMVSEAVAEWSLLRVYQTGKARGAEHALSSE